MVRYSCARVGSGRRGERRRGQREKKEGGGMDGERGVRSSNRRIAGRDEVRGGLKKGKGRIVSCRRRRKIESNEEERRV